MFASLMLSTGQVALASFDMHAFLVTLPVTIGLLAITKLALDGVFEQVKQDNA